MNRITHLSFVLFASLLAGSAALAQTAAPATRPTSVPAARPSPAGISSAVIDNNRIIVYYSRPFSKSPTSDEIRKIWGTLVPYGQVWRLGANEATHLITPAALTIGGATVPAGTYTLFMLPAENGPSKLIISKKVGQLGTEYDDKQDLARVDMTKSTLPEAANQLTLAITPNPAGGGTLAVRWENTEFAVPIAVKK